MFSYRILQTLQTSSHDSNNTIEVVIQKQPNVKHKVGCSHISLWSAGLENVWVVISIIQSITQHLLSEHIARGKKLSLNVCLLSAWCGTACLKARVRIVYVGWKSFAMATIGVRSYKGILQWANFSTKWIRDEEELFILQLTAYQQMSTEGVGVCDVPG